MSTVYEKPWKTFVFGYNLFGDAQLYEWIQAHAIQSTPRKITYPKLHKATEVVILFASLHHESFMKDYHTQQIENELELFYG